MINLFTPYYQCGDPIRQAEIDLCLENNIRNSQIDKLLIFIDDGSQVPFDDGKIEIIHLEQRPTYKVWLELTKTMKLRGHSILANSDIYFDHSLSSLGHIFSQRKTFLALSRWEHVQGEEASLHPNPHWSQDVWAVHCDDNISDHLLRTLNFPMGVPRCDNKVAYIFAVNGWKIANPCSDLKSYHVHESQIRGYHKKLDDRILGGVAYVHPTEDLYSASYLDFDVWAKNADMIKKVNLNKSLDKWRKELEDISDLNPDETDIEPLLPTTKPIRERLTLIDGGANSHTDDITQDDGSKDDVLTYMKNGQLLFDHLKRFRIYKHNNRLLFWDGLYPNKKLFLNAGDVPPINNDGLRPEHIAIWFPMIVDIAPIEVNDRPVSVDDSHFWQYPCTTEKQAHENHTNILQGENIDDKNKIISVYLPLPWASYIDKNTYPSEIQSILGPRVAGLKSLASACGYDLQVHTVCQQIHWKRFRVQFDEIGVTDLHISHCTTALEADQQKMRVHSWPLIAVNVENPTHSKGLVVGKENSEKRYLASFIGAHMPHYLSDIRVKLFQEYENDGYGDVLFELKGKWHFNDIVYKEQVANQKITSAQTSIHEDATLRYNSILSDSIFSLCPEGAGPNTLRVWESLAVGSIPVIITGDWRAPSIPNMNIDMEKFCVFVERENVNGLFQRLRDFDPSELKEKQQLCIEAYKNFQQMSIINNIPSTKKDRETVKYIGAAGAQ